MGKRFKRPGFVKQGNEEIQDVLNRTADFFNRQLQRNPVRLVTRVGAVSATTTIIVLPEAPSYGMKLGKVRVIVDTTHAADSTDYWTFSLGYYSTFAGLREYRDIEDASMDTTVVGLPAFVPVGFEVDHPLKQGETLVLIATKAASATALSGLCVEVEESFGGR